MPNPTEKHHPKAPDPQYTKGSVPGIRCMHCKSELCVPRTLNGKKMYICPKCGRGYNSR